MRVLAINLKKGEMRFVVLEGTKGHPSLLEKGKYDWDPDMETPNLMDNFHSNAAELINKTKPEKISYKLHWKINKKDDAKHHIMPIGVLNYIARIKNIAIAEHHLLGMTHKRLKFPKDQDKFEYIDTLITPQPPYWDLATKQAILAAILELDE